MDHELLEIQRLYAQLMALQRSGRFGQQSPEYKKMVVRIRALVDERKALRGDEMIVCFEAADQFGGRPWKT